MNKKTTSVPALWRNAAPPPAPIRGSAALQSPPVDNDQDQVPLRFGRWAWAWAAQGVKEADGAMLLPGEPKEKRPLPGSGRGFNVHTNRTDDSTLLPRNLGGEGFAVAGGVLPICHTIF